MEKKQLANPLAMVTCRCISMPGHEEGQDIEMSQRDAVEFAQIQKIQVLGEINYLAEEAEPAEVLEPAQEDDDVID